MAIAIRNCIVGTQPLKACSFSLDSKEFNKIMTMAMAAMAAKINDLIVLCMSLVVKFGIELDDKGQILHREEILKLMS